MEVVHSTPQSKAARRSLAPQRGESWGRFVFAAICDDLDFNTGVGVAIGDR